MHKEQTGHEMLGPGNEAGAAACTKVAEPLEEVQGPLSRPWRRGDSCHSRCFLS